MKLSYTTKNTRLLIQLEGNDVKESFKQLAEAQEIFDEPCCALCKSQDIKYVVRTIENNDFYELKCCSCNAKLSFGQHKNGGTLFPKRKDHFETKGWHRWTPDKK